MQNLRAGKCGGREQEAKEEIKETEETLENRVIDEKGVGLNQTSVSKEDAI